MAPLDQRRDSDTRENADATSFAGYAGLFAGLTKVESLGTLQDRYRGIGPGFDFLRLFLSIAIFYAHTNFALRESGLFATVSGGAIGLTIPDAVNAVGWMEYLGQVKSRVYVFLVPVFFAISGYLVAGSAFRTRKVIPFLRLRVLRIFPALVVEVVLSAILLGILFTTLPLSDYFTDPQFWRYMGNMIGYISFYLPGVFDSNPAKSLVNVNLWTLPAEFYCYLILAGLIGTGVLFRQKALTILFAIITAGLIIASLSTGFGLQPSIYSTVAVTYYFIFGVMFYIGRNLIPMNAVLFVIATCVIFVFIRDIDFTFILPACVVYVTIYVGYSSRLRLAFMRGRDYSYGIYLYGFPITQSVVALYPEIDRLALFGVAFSITLVFSVLSWHLVEKPVLKFK